MARPYCPRRCRPSSGVGPPAPPQQRVTSHRPVPRASAPRSRSSRSTWASRSTDRAARTSEAPSLANASATALPIPREAAVTRTTLPLNDESIRTSWCIGNSNSRVVTGDDPAVALRDPCRGSRRLPSGALVVLYPELPAVGDTERRRADPGQHPDGACGNGAEAEPGATSSKAGRPAICQPPDPVELVDTFDGLSCQDRESSASTAELTPTAGLPSTAPPDALGHEPTERRRSRREREVLRFSGPGTGVRWCTSGRCLWAG